jgi:hypothetical protein
MFPRYRTCKIVGAVFALIVVVSTLQAQVNSTPTPTPTATATVEPSPTPATECDTCQQAQLDEAITLRRLLILFGGMWMGWQTCVLIYKWV